MTSYFKDQGKRGENAELQEELASSDKTKKRDAVKKVIRDMTLGKDVSGLFTSVVNCMMTPNLEVRKLVYLYLINYAKTQPDLAIMAVNGFVKDCGDPNPLIRALAVRTMGCIRVEQISEYLCEPLRKALKDQDPYVRKTAAITVAKLYEISPDLVVDQGFIDGLNDLLGDGNPMVVSNSVAALAEISTHGESKALHLNNVSVLKLLAVLNECSEWGQIFILDVLATYDPTLPDEAEKMAERIKPRLQHANSAVVLSATKVILKLLDVISNPDTVQKLVKSMGPPLITLMSHQAEIQYVALRNIQLICQKRADILQSEVKVFFCKYNDPIYVKMEKLDVLVMLSSERNIDQVLMEFKEYATEIDDELVCKAVRCIGRCAVKLDCAAERCVQVLVELIQTKVNYVVQEAIIVIRDIFRKYPNKYESVIGTLCENLDTLDDSEAKASMIWVVGEYADRIDNAAELLESFLDSFREELPPVQLQLLTAVVKLFLKRPAVAQDMVKRVLALVTQNTDNPDLRDRGYMYWRLLSTDPEGAKGIVLAQKPTIEDDTNAVETTLLSELVSGLGSLSSVYHKRPAQFVDRRRAATVAAEEYDEADEADDIPSSHAPAGGGDVAAAPSAMLDMLSLDDATPAPPAPAAGNAGGGLLDDLLSLDAPVPAVKPPQAAAVLPGGLLDIMGGAPVASEIAAPSGPPAGDTLPVLLQTDKGKGMTIRGSVARQPGGSELVYELAFSNSTDAPLGDLALQINKNALGVAAPAAPLAIAPIAPGGTASTTLPLVLDPSKVHVKPAAGFGIQVAVKSTVGVFYFTDTLPLAAVHVPTFTMEQQAYLSTWPTLEAHSAAGQMVGLPISSADSAEQCLNAAGLRTVARRPLANPPGTTALYLAGRSLAGHEVLMEVQICGAAARVQSRAAVPGLAALYPPAVERALRTYASPSLPNCSFAQVVPAASGAVDLLDGLL